LKFYPPWRDNTWRNDTWRDNTWRNDTWRDNTWRDNTWRDNTWRDNTWRDDPTGRSKRARTLVLLVQSVLLLLLSASCFGRGAPPVELTPVRLRMASFPAGSAWARAEDALIAQFQTDHAHITVARQGYQQPIDQTLAASPPPDLMLIGTVYALSQAARQGQILDVTELWEESALLQNYPPAFRQLSQFEGQAFFVPIGYPWSAIYYNRAIFAELGLQPPQTWDEFLVLCETLLNAGITPLAFSSDDPTVAMIWFEYLNLRLNGPEFHRQLLQGEISFEEPRVVAVLESWQTLLARGYFVENPGQAGSLESLMALVRGGQVQLEGEQAAMFLGHSALLAELPPTLRGELDFFRFPVVDPALPVAETLLVYGYMIPKEAEQVESALTFLAYAASPEAQTLVAQQLNSTAVVFAPTNLAVAHDELPDDLQRGMALVGEADALVPPFLLNLPDSMAMDVNRALQSWLRRPDAVYEFAAALERARQSALADNLLSPSR
jgi:multiple sugar transport system substrate-binding protein/raffinose/stachyose/melibiose transport system substrate-binding protein